MPDGDITFYCISYLVVLALSLGVAWVGLFTLWKRRFHGKPVDTINQRIKLLGWFILVAIVSYCTYWFLRWFIS